MTKETYSRLSAPFRGRPKAVRALKLGNKALSLSCYILYPALLLWMLLERDGRLWRLLLTPGLSFAAVSVYRKWRNSPRPYEVLDIEPLISRDKKGESFPSRHVFSVFIIAMAWGYVCPAVGWILGCAGVLLAIIRVLAGIHFPRDVAAGAAIGVAAGLLGFYVI